MFKNNLFINESSNKWNINKWNTNKVLDKTFKYDLKIDTIQDLNPLSKDREKLCVGVIMGSKSDLPIMQQAIDVLNMFDIEVKTDVVSAHRTPERMMLYGKNAVDNGLSIIIAGAGGAAHLPGMIASLTPLPVIGVPIKSSNSLDGWDSILSILQMPNGVPVATVALNGAKNAGILAASMLGINNKDIQKKIIEYKTDMKNDVLKNGINLI